MRGYFVQYSQSIFVSYFSFSASFLIFLNLLLIFSYLLYPIAYRARR